MDNNFPDIDIEAGAESEAFSKCDLCTNSKCCTYVTQQIDAPRSKYDFEILLWQVSHDGVGAYKDDDGWFVMFESRCQHLLGDGRCNIYADRPTICRSHSNDYCEYDVRNSNAGAPAIHHPNSRQIEGYAYNSRGKIVDQCLPAR